MEIVFSPKCLNFGDESHPESPERVRAIANHLSSCCDFDFVEPGFCLEEDLFQVHSSELIQKVRSRDFVSSDSPAYEGVYEFAKLAVGGAIKASEMNGFSLLRPLGHHAGFDYLGGFCYFNNLAVAVKKLDKEVAIIDFDCHFGDGTSSIFYDSDKVFYFSIHQWPAYPNKRALEMIGEGKGRGYTANLPLPPGSGDDVFIKAFKKFLPFLKQFDPELIAVSAGFDAHKLDPLVDLNVSSNCYFEIGQLIKENFGSFFSCLEGGYGSKVPECCESYLKGLNGQYNPMYEEKTTSDASILEKVQKNIDQLEGKLSDYWRF